ncbi:MAG TPA: polyketide synthase [Polyangiaceae bacterium]|nr:polyketide synthase [Polyangiaceae bacterium]
MTPREGTAAPIAIVGMGARFPGARNVEAFWDNLVNARETVSTLDEATLRQNEIDYDALKGDPDYVPRAGVLDDVEQWDNGFFRCNARQAALMDPQHRIWLECAWDALEDGCLDPARFAGNVGVYLGIGTRGNYLMANIVPDRAYLETFVRNGDVDVYETQLVNDRDYIATRTAFLFGLRGPAMTVQCACSTSLAAVAQACHSIWSGESDAALAGGASIQLPQARGYRYSPGGMFSRDGSTRSFDADASGTVFTCGVGAVLLQRLEDAVADRRPIYAVIRGAAVNNDGGVTQSYVAPHEDGQARVVELAQRMAGIDARSVSYVEAHGTATPVGDPIEVRALSRAFRRHTTDKGFCGIGSVKSNIGHTSAAAGVAGLIKTTLALHHRQLPPTLHFKRPNPQIDFAESPFSVIDSLRPWESDGPRRAGVSAFGVGGGNAHIVLEEVSR